MSSTYNKPYRPKIMFSIENIIIASISWGVLAVLYFLLFSAKIPNPDGIERRADWYVYGTYIFEAVAYLNAGILCLRNWRSPQIVSGRYVWLAIGMGMLSYFVGGICFDYKEKPIISSLSPIIATLSDVFFIMTYLLLGVGMILAVTSRRLNLEKWQWIIVIAIGSFGSALTWLISNLPEVTRESVQADKIAQILNWFYVTSDVLLLMIATILLLAFWGGRMSLSWRMIAAAAISLYIADMWFKYADKIPNYQSGEILEVFWVISGVLFGMGAALEYDASLNRSRRERGRKRA